MEEIKSIYTHDYVVMTIIKGYSYENNVTVG